LVKRAGLTVEAVRGSVYYPPIGVLASPLARCDRWLGTITTVGAAFIALAARKPATGVSSPQQNPKNNAESRGLLWNSSRLSLSKLVFDSGLARTCTALKALVRIAQKA
jgi:hypothetical protein